MGDTHPLATSEHFVLMDVRDSRTDLNMASDGDNFREGKPSIFSPYNINGRAIVIAIALFCFLLSLMLFIGTVVVYYSRPTPLNEGCQLSSSSSSRVNGGISNVDFDDNNKNFFKQSDFESSNPPSEPTGFSELDRSVTTVNGKHARPGQLIYSEEFTSFNTTAWEHVVGADSDNHFYYNVNERNNSFVRDGKLFIKPTYTADKYGEDFIYNGTLFLGTIPSDKCLNQSALCWKKPSSHQTIIHPIMSAMVTSKDSFRFKYGRLVIRAKMPAGDWVEPILSLQPHGSIYGEGLVSGQVHLTDTRGNRKLFNAERENIGSEHNCPDIRFGLNGDNRITFYCLRTPVDEGYDTKFRDYEVLWTPDSITVKIDGEGLVMAPTPRPSMYKLWSKGRTVKNPWNDASNKVMAPFDTEFYLAIGLAVGGTSGFFRDDFTGPYNKPWANNDPSAPKSFWENRKDWEPSWEGDNSALQIESIKLWSLNTTTSD